MPAREQTGEDAFAHHRTTRTRVAAYEHRTAQLHERAERAGKVDHVRSREAGPHDTSQAGRRDPKRFLAEHWSLYRIPANALCYRAVMRLLSAATMLGCVVACGQTVRHVDLEYVPNGHARQKLDLHLPAEGKNWPLVVWVHGGAWRVGDKKNVRLPEHLVSRGFAVASVNYRLSQHAIFPAQIDDCKAAVAWLRANASKYGYDARRIGAWGPSAGGHLVAMLGATNTVHAVVDYFGPSDLLKMDEQGGPAGNHNAPDSPESQLLGGPLQQRGELAAAANPITYIAKLEAGLIPPFLIVHGDADRTVPPGQSVLLAEALKKAGARVEIILLPGSGHGGPAFETPEMIEKVTAFFKQHLSAK
jgi:acetyl esterase/lipase